MQRIAPRLKVGPLKHTSFQQTLHREFHRSVSSQQDIGRASSAIKNGRHNAFICMAPETAPGQVQTGVLAGCKIAVKDNICTMDMPTTCASSLLRGYISPFDATVVELLRQAGAKIVGKTNLDEFGMGSHSVNSVFGKVRGIGAEYSAGGSSGGSAVAVAQGDCHAALGTDTGGSVRLPAAFCGVYGFKPSYGLLSRWGVVAYANSLDTVGLLSMDLSMIRELLSVLSVQDARDPTSLPTSAREKMAALAKRPAKPSLRVGIPKEYNTSELSGIVRKAWLKTIQSLKDMGHSIHGISLPTTQTALSAYYVLAPAEASSNLAKYDGVRYGVSAEEPNDSATAGPLYSSTRHQGFGREVRSRILLGSYSLSADAIDNYFIKAQKVRRLVQQDFDRAFTLPNLLHQPPAVAADDGDTVDVIVCPTASDLPPSLDQLKHQKTLEACAADVFTVPASLAGLPALNIPVRVEANAQKSFGGPNSVGMQIIAQFGDDDTVLRVGSMLEALR